MNLGPPRSDADCAPGAFRERLPKVVISAVLTFVLALMAYAPLVLPDVGLWDVAEFQTVPHVLGIAHPTGYPLYTLVGKLWLLLWPFGTVAFKMNLLSAVASAGAASVLAGLAAWHAGIIAGVAFALLYAFAPAYWRVAIRADPHSLNALMVAGALALALAWGARPKFGLLAALALWCGLGVGNHMIVAMLAPAVLVFVACRLPRHDLRIGRAAQVIGCLGLGLSVYAYLPLRSAMNPPLNYGHPTTLERFIYLVSGEQFHGSMHFASLEGLAKLGGRLAHYPAYLAEWYGFWGAILVGGFGVVGLVWLCIRKQTTGLFLVIAFAVPFYIASGYENADLHRYHFAPHAILILMAAWGFGLLRGLWGRWRNGAIAILVLPFLLWRSSGAVLAAEHRDDYPRRFIEAIYRVAPKNSIVLSWWSYSTALWYGRWVEGKRPDLTIVDHRNLLDEGWKGDYVNFARTQVGHRPIVVVYLDADLKNLRDAGFILQPLADSRFGPVGFLLKIPIATP